MALAVTDETIRIVDVALRYFAEQMSIEQMTAGLWELLEEGRLRFTSTGLEFCDESRAERRAQAKRNRSLIKAKRKALMQMETSKS
jgi:hypothetical protein